MLWPGSNCALEGNTSIFELSLKFHRSMSEERRLSVSSIEIAALAAALVFLDFSGLLQFRGQNTNVYRQSAWRFRKNCEMDLPNPVLLGIERAYKRASVPQFVVVSLDAIFSKRGQVSVASLTLKRNPPGVRYALFTSRCQNFVPGIDWTRDGVSARRYRKQLFV